MGRGGHISSFYPSFRRLEAAKEGKWFAKKADLSDGAGGEQDWRGLHSQESTCPVHQQAGEPLTIVPMTFSSLYSWRRGWKQRPWSPMTQGLVDALDANDSKSRVMDAKGLRAGGTMGGGQGQASLDVL